MIRAILIAAAIAASALALSTGGAHADSLNIHQATLAEANQKTPEVSTEQLRRILADGSAIVLDTRTRAEFDAGHIPGARNLDAPAGAAGGGGGANGERGQEQGAGALLQRPLLPGQPAAGRPTGQRPATRMCGVTSSGSRSGARSAARLKSSLSGIARIFKADRTAVYLDAGRRANSRAEALPGAHNVPADEVAAGRLKKTPAARGRFQPPYRAVRARRCTGAQACRGAQQKALAQRRLLSGIVRDIGRCRER